MNLRPTLSILLAFIAFNSSAQNKAVTFGIAAGVTSTSLSRTKLYEDVLTGPQKSGFGYFAEAFVSFDMGRLWLQPAVSFTSIAAHTTDEFVSGDIVEKMDGKWRLNYLKVPIDLVYKVPCTGGQFYFGGGPYLAAALSGKFTSSDDKDHTGSNYLTVKAQFGDGGWSNFRSVDSGLNALAGFAFDSGVTLNAVYCFGLTNVESIDDRLYSNTKIRSLGLSLGYKFK